MLHGKTALVVGGTSGTGYRMAAELGRLGAFVFVTGAEPGEVESRLRAVAGHRGIRWLPGETLSVGGNQAVAARLSGQTDRLHILVNATTRFYRQRTVTLDGIESTLSHNLVGPFVLTDVLTPLLERAGSAVVANVIAPFATGNGDPFADVQERERYTPVRAYSRSAALRLLWTIELGARMRGRGIAVVGAGPEARWSAMAERSAIELADTLPALVSGPAGPRRAWALAARLAERAPTARPPALRQEAPAGREWA